MDYCNLCNTKNVNELSQVSITSSKKNSCFNYFNNLYGSDFKDRYNDKWNLMIFFSSVKSIRNRISKKNMLFYQILYFLRCHNSKNSFLSIFFNRFSRGSWFRYLNYWNVSTKKKSFDLIQLWIGFLFISIENCITILIFVLFWL